MAKKPPKDGLEKYRQKRTAGNTTEPFGNTRATPTAKGPAIFVVQKHAATRLHYDFRLEWSGVLFSWAIPRGPSLDPADKRLAVHVENHPVEYADFEGIIPEGNYGAGAVIVWDRGLWEPLVDPQTSYEEGNMKFKLHGHKLRGEYALVRTKRPREKAPSNEWLLLKKKDGYACEGELGEYSVLSGLTIEEMKAGPVRQQEIIEELDAATAKKRKVDPFKVRLSLCETADEPFSGEDWIYEIKHDGYRLIAAVDDERPVLRYRRGSDVSHIYPELTLALRSLPYESLVLDGEVCVLDDSGRADFNRLQQRAMLSRNRDIRNAMRAHPAILMVFDLLSFGGRDVRGLPLMERKRLLEQIVPKRGVLRYVDHIEEQGELFYEKLSELGLEGMVCKRRDASYAAGRSDNWLKARLSNTHDFAVIGYAKPENTSRTGFRSLHLAVRDGGEWVYAGSVGSGFSEAELVEYGEKLRALPTEKFDFETTKKRTTVWCEPVYVAEVRYMEWRDGHHVRQPVFVRWREDKDPKACVRPTDDKHPPEPTAVDDSEDREIRLSNLGKVFWPEEGYTKGDLIDYYREIAPWVLPYLKGRPVVLTRYPDGIHGKSFYQKDAPDWVPSWVRTETVWSEHSQRDIHYFVCEDADTLVYLANLGTIPLHVWASRADDLARPDWCIIDLDPKGAPWEDVIKVAQTVHRLCDDIGLPAFAKTSGSTGIHILIPLGRQCTHEQCRNLAGLLVQTVEQEVPDIATTQRVIERREGKVYLDWLQNRHGQLLVSPYSVRPVPGALVSMPLKWSEVTKKLDFKKFTIKTAAARMKRLKSDPLLGVMTEQPELLAALERLSERMA